MADLSAGFADVDELVLTRLEGHLLSARRPTRASVEIRLESFDEEDQPNVAHLRFEMTIADAEPTADEILFEALVSYTVRLREGMPTANVGKAGLFALLWPYLRASMLEHAARFGHGRLSLPIHLSVEQLIEGEAETMTSGRSANAGEEPRRDA